MVVRLTGIDRTGHNVQSKGPNCRRAEPKESESDTSRSPCPYSILRTLARSLNNWNTGSSRLFCNPR